jgi:thiol-disulfide isomerase/thioredoxin
VLGAACGGAQHGSGHGFALDPVVLDAVDGGTIDLSDFRGRPVVIFFFTTYSGPAQEIAPFLAQVAIRHDRDGLAVVGVALEPGNGPVVAAWRDFLALPFPVAVATQNLVDGHSPLGRVPAVPSFAFLDRSGALVGWDIRLLHEGELERIVRALLAE